MVPCSEKKPKFALAGKAFLDQLHSPSLANGEIESPHANAPHENGPPVSDTHLPRFGQDLPAALKQGLIAQQVELILHLGDFTSLAVADMFRRIAPFDAVAGNNDPDEICRSFGRRKIPRRGWFAHRHDPR